jgi:protoporphyrinogen oxidase
MSDEQPRVETLPPKDVVILGAGLAGLSAGYILSKAGRGAIVLEADSKVGGLAKTVTYGEFKFDLGGHRFITGSKRLEHFVREILNGDLLVVQRKSKIYVLNRYFDYPLRPANAIFSLGLATTVRIITDYCREKVKNRRDPSDIVSLEDWVISRFGRKIFDLYFREYSEKVWGIDCRKISSEWVAQRITKLSLWAAIKRAFFKFSGGDIRTLSNKFMYPSMGIGQISDRLRKAIEEQNRVATNTRAVQMKHHDSLVKSGIAENDGHLYNYEAREFVSTVPLTKLVQMLRPVPEKEILEAASRLRYRSIVLVTIMLNRERVTDLTWIYVPEREIPLGRIHEPKNWSLNTAPKGKTHIVSEYFCFTGDAIWSFSDEELVSMTVEQLEKLGFMHEGEVIDSCIVRVANAYPVLEVGYRQHYHVVLNYLQTFKNLHIGGRTGMFKYYNMDHAMESGILVGENIIKRQSAQRERPSGRRPPLE